jgi:hypothetical protein
MEATYSLEMLAYFEIQGVTTQKTVIFIVTIVRALTSTC